MRHAFFCYDTPSLAILRDGFRDLPGQGAFSDMAGTYVVDRLIPTDPAPEAYVRVDLEIDDQDLVPFEDDGCPGLNGRQWFLPASLLRGGRVRRVRQEEIERANISKDGNPFRRILDQDGGLTFMLVYREPDGPVNAPEHIPGKWYWCNLHDVPGTEVKGFDRSRPFDTLAEAERAAQVHLDGPNEDEEQDLPVEPYQTFYAYVHDVEDLRSNGFTDVDLGSLGWGVRLTDRPLGERDGIQNASLLILQLEADEDVSQYEVRGDTGQPYREWVVPASVANDAHWRRATQADLD